MKIGVIGGGSIGLLISRYFAKHHEVTIYVRRDEQKRQLNKYGLQLSNSSVSYPIRSLLINEIKDEDCFVFCVKQHHLEEVIATVQKVDSQSPFIFLQNGIGHSKILEEIEELIKVGVIEQGAYRKSDHLDTHTGKGVIKLASYVGDVSKLYERVKQQTLADYSIQAHQDWQ